MSTLTEIEAAVERLSQPQLEELMVFVAKRINRPTEESVVSEDPFEALIGAFAGPKEATGRKAEEILYGTRA